MEYLLRKRPHLLQRLAQLIPIAPALLCLPLIACASAVPIEHRTDTTCATDSSAWVPAKQPGTVRFATFNVYMNRSAPGELIAALRNGEEPQVRAVAEIIQRVAPDVLLLNEFDHDDQGLGLALFQKNYLSVSQNGNPPLNYPYSFVGPSNTGVPTAMDLDRDGRSDGPGDALGFGEFPGQYGMALLSQIPIDRPNVRSFQQLLWRDMPGALLPDDPASATPADYYQPQQLAQLRLSSKSHWDIPLRITDARSAPDAIIHVLAAHPTPPVFDGPEDRNGRRNHDEIRLWADYIGSTERGAYLRDDNGRTGGLGTERFVILGDYNADPFDGDTTAHAARLLTEHPAVTDTRPTSSGAARDAASEGQANAEHRGDPAADTADFNPAGPGNLRVDYVLPSRQGLTPGCQGVFWPAPESTAYRLVGSGYPVVSSDHRLVWLDVTVRALPTDP